MQINQQLNVNGSDDKPFPQERNFVISDATSEILGQGANYTPAVDHDDVPNHFGQVKYARREGARSIYKDETRNTANDNAASAKAEGSCVGDLDNSSYDESAEESQGI